jgi:PKD repeat protein
VAVLGDYLFVADSDAGLIILRFIDKADLGTITIKKQTEPGANNGFSFDGDLGSFVLSGEQSKLFSELLPGPYTITEVETTGWELEDIFCDSENVTKLDDGITVQLDAGETVTCTFTNTKLNPPIANLIASPNNGVRTLTVDFTNLSTGDFDQCLWDFGDSNTSAICIDPSHTYAESGTYTVRLAVQGPGGDDTITKTDYIAVYEPVKADFGTSPEMGAPPLIVEFTNYSTGDFNQCLWDFGDGQTATTCDDPFRKYEIEGHYTVSLTIKGPGGEDTKTVERCVNVAYYRLFLPGILNAK